MFLTNDRKLRIQFTSQKLLDCQKVKQEEIKKISAVSHLFCIGRFEKFIQFGAAELGQLFLDWFLVIAFPVQIVAKLRQASGNKQKWALFIIARQQTITSHKIKILLLWV